MANTATNVIKQGTFLLVFDCEAYSTEGDDRLIIEVARVINWPAKSKS